MVKQSRKFGGKKFQWVGTKSTKGKAKVYVRWVRSHGWNARVVKGQELHRQNRIQNL